MANVRFPVGRQRLHHNVRPSQAGYTRAIRAQMKQIVDNMQKVIKAIHATSKPALQYALQPIYDDSQVLVPVDKGPLKASGFIEVRDTARGVTGVVGYAKGGNPHYAVYVHERMDLQHSAPTQAKFLEEPVMRHLRNIPARYASYVKQGVGL